VVLPISYALFFPPSAHLPDRADEARVIQATLEMDPTNLILGIQPVFVYGAATIGCVGLGWLAGPVLGSGVWKLVNRRNVKAMEAKDKGTLSLFFIISLS